MIFIVNAIATVLWMELIWGLDKLSSVKKSEKPLLLFLLAGMASIIPTSFLYLLSPVDVHDESVTAASMFFYDMFIVGPIEEFSKFIAFLFLTRRFAPIREPRDGILYAAAVAVGFAAVENLSYGSEYGLYNLIVRSVLCTTGHVTYGAIWGYYYSLVVYEGDHRRGSIDFRPAFLALVPASFAHGLYDFFIDMSIFPAGVALNIVAGAIALRLFKIHGGRSPYRNFSLAEYHEAVVAYKKALAVDPNNGVLNKRLALFYLYGSRFREALAHIDRSVQADPGNAYLKCLRGAALMLNGNLDGGKEALAGARGRLTRRQRDILLKNIELLIRDASKRGEILAVLAPAAGMQAAPAGPSPRVDDGRSAVAVLTVRSPGS